MEKSRKFDEEVRMMHKGRVCNGTTWAEDTWGVANNPATMVFLGRCIGTAAKFFDPWRTACFKERGFLIDGTN